MYLFISLYIYIFIHFSRIYFLMMMFYFLVRTRFQRSHLGRLFDVLARSCGCCQNGTYNQLATRILVATSFKLYVGHSRRGFIFRIIYCTIPTRWFLRFAFGFFDFRFRFLASNFPFGLLIREMKVSTRAEVAAVSQAIWREGLLIFLPRPGAFPSWATAKKEMENMSGKWILLKHT